MENRLASKVWSTSFKSRNVDIKKALKNLYICYFAQNL